MKKWNTYRPYETPAQRAERELVAGQRRRLEALVQRQTRDNALERVQALFADFDMKALASLETLLEAVAETDRADVLSEIVKSLGARFGQRPLTAPLPQTLPGLLQLLARYTQGPGAPGARRRTPIRLENLDWQGLHLDAPDFTGVEMRHIRWPQARLEGARLFAARVENADWSQAQLRRADLTGATLQNVDLTGADLRDAKLISTELLDCDLRDVDFTGASLRGARLAGSDLRGANLAGVTDANYRQLLVCRLDASTRLPAAMEYYRRELIARSDARQA